MTDGVSFVIADSFSGKPVGDIDPATYQFNDPLAFGGGGSFSATVAIPTNKQASNRLKRLTALDVNTIHCLYDDEIIPCSSYIINFRSRTPGSNVLTIKGQQLKTWFYQRFIVSYKFGISNGLNLQWTEGYSRLGVDEYQHVANLMAHYFTYDNINGLSGIVPISYDGSALSGDLRDLTVPAFTSYGEAFDRIAKRDGGFEWSIGTRKNSQTGYFEYFMELWSPGALRAAEQLLYLDNKDTTNKVTFGEWAEDASGAASRVFASGDGSAPAIPTAYDQDPALGDPLLLGDEDRTGVLLREAVSNYSGVVHTDTLFDHARAERLARGQATLAVNCDVSIDQPKVSSYRTGDRARVRVVDDWDEIDLEAVRIVDKTVTKNSGSAPVSTLSLDLADFELPEDQL